MITGTITRIEDHGTIVLVWIDQTPVYFDHRPFGHFVADYPNPIGLEVSYDGGALEVL